MQSEKVVALVKPAPEVEGLVASAVFETGRSLDWTYFNPDNCTPGAVHIRVRLAHASGFGSEISIVENGVQDRFRTGFFETRPTLESIVNGVEWRRADLLEADFSAVLPEVVAARACLEAGMLPHGPFKDAWTCPSSMPDYLYYVRRPRYEEWCDDNQHIVSEGNGPILHERPVEAGVARWDGSYRVFTLAKDIHEALRVVKDGFYLRVDGDPYEQKGVPIQTFRHYWKLAEQEARQGRAPGF